MPIDGVPDRAHFLVSDLTEAPGDWSPRNSQWKEVLVDGTGAAQQKPVADVLNDVRMTEELRAFALTEAPFGLWLEKPECAQKLGAVPKVSSLPATSRPRWIDETRASESASVYTQTPGETIFKTICRNCHGPQADSAGILAQAILDMTGGQARVADFRSGLFGPRAMPGANRETVFSSVANANATTEDWAARYMSWMALGGTDKSLPPSLLSIVSVTGVLGVQRSPSKLEAVGTPNMLKLAYDLCWQTVTASAGEQRGSLANLFSRGHFDWGQQTALISRNGDAEMWLKLCSMGNRPIVRVIDKIGRWDDATQVETMGIDPIASLFYADAYPADAPVLDHEGKVQKGITKQNYFPLCIPAPSDPTQKASFDAFLNANHLGGAGGPMLPVCPESWAKERSKWQLKVVNVDGRADLVDRRTWSTRGAANAGFSVFAYLDQFIKAGGKPKPDYNHCEDLP